jgi:Ca2+-binding RTX toxin-like protein
MVSFGADSIDGGNGTDMLSYSNINYGGSAATGVTVSMSAMTYGSIEGITGSGSRDSLTGDGGDNRLRGLTGNDSLYGEGGNDTLDGGNSNDWLVGGLGGDLLQGSAGQDTLHGQSGHDTLDGGTGDDHLYGGNGDDLFIFASGSGHDAIHDFDIADDTIRFDGFGGDTPTVTAGSGFASLSFASGDLLTISYTGGDWDDAQLIGLA